MMTVYILIIISTGFREANSVTTVPLPYSTMELCLEAGKAWRDSTPYYDRKFVCIPAEK